MPFSRTKHAVIETPRRSIHAPIVHWYLLLRPAVRGKILDVPRRMLFNSKKRQSPRHSTIEQIRVRHQRTNGEIARHPGAQCVATARSRRTIGFLRPITREELNERGTKPVA